MFDIIQVLFKSLSSFQHFKRYNSHSQGKDIEWTIYITVSNFKPVKTKKIAYYMVKIYG